MKKLIISIISVILPITLLAENNIYLKTKINNVNLFLTGAEINRIAKINIKQGNNIYIIKGLSPYMDKNTIQITGKGNFTILGVSSQNNFLEKIPANSKIYLYKDSVNYYTRTIENNNQMLNVYAEEKSMILANKTIKGNNQNLNPDDLQKLADFYRSRLKDINFKTIELNRKNKKFNNRVSVLNKQIKELSLTYKKNTKEILINILSKTQTTGKLIISYKVNNAGWIPSYDIRSTSTNKNIEITYKAKIYQNTGIDWKNIKLTLSTGDLNINNTKPELYPWYLNYYNIYKKKYTNYNKTTRAMKPQNVTVDDEYATEAPVTESKSIADFSKTIKNITNTEFKISLSLNLKSNNKGKLIKIKNDKLPAQYRYLAIPKINNKVFLIARITDWEKLNLLPGEISLYNKQTYVGKSYLDPSQINDTLEISLSNDPSISVNRKIIKDFNKSVIIGNYRKVTKAYEIKIRNNKQVDINILIQDQIPISTIKEIEVSHDKILNGKINETTGIISWETNLKPNENKKYDFKYTVKYPKNKRITNL